MQGIKIILLHIITDWLAQEILSSSVFLVAFWTSVLSSVILKSAGNLISSKPFICVFCTVCEKPESQPEVSGAPTDEC